VGERRKHCDTGELILSKHGNNPDLKIDTSYRPLNGGLVMRGLYKGREMIRIDNGGVHSEPLPVSIEEADAVAALYKSATHQYLFITAGTDERVLEAVWGEHHAGVKLYE
jgi:hypothetical protein